MSTADEIVKKQRQVMGEIRQSGEYVRTYSRYAEALPNILADAAVPAERTEGIVEAFIDQNFEKCLDLLRTTYEERKSQEPENDGVRRLNNLVSEIEIISRFK